MYYNKGLGVHRDSIKLFKRPIISLRLFAPTVLHFGCYGQVSEEMSPSFGIPLEVGAVTVMEGVAADYYQHCIRQRDFSGSF